MESGPRQASEGISELCVEYWSARLENDPVSATALGIRDHDSELEDVTPEGRSKAVRQYRSVVERASHIDPSKLNQEDRVTLEVLLVDAESAASYIECGLDDWTVDPLQGPQVSFLNIESFQPVRTPAEGIAMAKRWNRVGPYLDATIANLRTGANEGKFASRVGVEKSIEELVDLLKKPEGELPFLLPLSVAHPDWTSEERTMFEKALREAVGTSIRPGYERYLGFLREVVLPNSRSPEHPGVVNISGGREVYAKLVRYHTSLDISPEDLHQTGLSEVKKINGEMAELGEKAFGLRDRAEILERLRTDRDLYFTSRDEVEDKARKALERATSAIPRWFGRLPKTPCEVVRMGEHEEKHSTIAYYRQPAADGTRPGRYYINTYEPETRPRYEAEVLAYHESIPGHHLQLAIAQELEGIPDFRRFSGVTAFIEGWGLYTERLSDEMGLYSSDLDRIGVLSYDGWRACRLVVDTGMHATGWSRDRAIDFMMQNTALARNNIINEVDRYISWPGQALAYKTGQLEIRRLRKSLEAKLGSAFDIRRFHDNVLENGALPLQVLRRIISS